MSGKSTWIANLFAEETTKVLTEIFERNREGQTKIATHYLLMADDKKKLTLNRIEWNDDEIQNIKETKELPEETKKAVDVLSRLFGLKELINNEDVLNSNLILSIELSGGANLNVCDI